MKKSLCYILSLLLLSSLVACGSTDDESKAPDESSTVSDFSSAAEESSKEETISQEESSEEPSVEESSEEPVKEPVTMPEIKEYIPMTFRKNDTGVFMTANDSQEAGHKIEVSMVKTVWGTWNLGYFKATDTDAKKTVTMNPGGTDWCRRNSGQHHLLRR